MPRFRRAVLALALGLSMPVFPAIVHAGGGIGAGGGGIALNGEAAVVLTDHTTPPGHNYSFLRYFSQQVSVHQGDVVTFQMANNPLALHTITFVPANVPYTDKGLQGLFGNVGNPVPDKNDPVPGLTSNYNVYQQSSCGNSPYFPGTGPCSYDGTRPVNSGFLFYPAAFHQPGSNQPQRYSVRMNVKPGVYHYFCLIHGPQMGGTIRVVAPSVRVPTAQQDLAQGERQYQVAARNAMQYESHLSAPPAPGANGHRTWHVFTGSQYGQTEIDEFVPQRISPKPGDSVVWTPGFHTVTFTAGQPVRAVYADCNTQPRDSAISNTGSWCNNLETDFKLAGATPSGPPGRAYTGGVYGSGILVLPKPRTWNASFPQAGTYQYVCLLHPGMVGTVAVG